MLPTIEVPVDGLDLVYLQNHCAQNIGYGVVDGNEREEPLFRMIELKRAMSEYKKTASGGCVYLRINHSEAMHLLMHCNHICAMMPDNTQAEAERVRKLKWVADLRKLEV